MLVLYIEMSLLYAKVGFMPCVEQST